MSYVYYDVMHTSALLLKSNTCHIVHQLVRETFLSLLREKERATEREREREKETDMSLREENPSTHVGCTRGVGPCNILVERLGT